MQTITEYYFYILTLLLLKWYDINIKEIQQEQTAVRQIKKKNTYIEKEILLWERSIEQTEILNSRQDSYM